MLRQITLLGLLAMPAFAQQNAIQGDGIDVRTASSPVTCVAVFELMSRELPSHLREPEMGFAWRVWHLEARRAGQAYDRDIAIDINARISELNPLYAEDPYRLVDAAERCVHWARTSSSDRS